MAEYTANAPQDVAVGEAVLFTDTISKGGCITHREGSGQFVLHGGKKYIVSFGANITGGTANTEVALALTINGELIPVTRMSATPSVIGALNNVSRVIEITVPPCCCYTISIENVGTIETSVQNADLIIKGVRV